MLSVEEALEKILNFVSVLKPEEKHLINCLGQVLSDDITAPFDVPPANNSAMDGYAVQANSIYEATRENPKVLKVIGEVPAGSIADHIVAPGTAIRIMTGAIIPGGADVVIPFEETDEDKRKGFRDKESEIGIYNPLKTGANIRKKGEDISKGQIVMKQSKLLFPADIGVLASLGKAKVSVIRRPVVGILATGNEVLDVSQSLSPGKIYNSNSYSLAAQVIDCGGIPRLLGVASDDIGQLTSALHQGLNCDMLVTSGGVSVGDYDMVKEVLAAEGSISFWTVRMKPGKPLAFGTFKSTNGRSVPHLGLPGNPVSSMITFEIFVRPALYKMMGRSDWTRNIIKAVAEDSLKNKDGRRIFARVLVSKWANEYYIRLTGEQGSGILTSMAKANGLAIIPETISEVKPGMILDVIMLKWDSPRGLQEEGEF
jgi:molybdopterin molybdotransferase